MSTSETTTDTSTLLELDDLAVVFARGLRRPPLRAVDGVSLKVMPRETVGVVGESGSGKTTIGRAILGLVPVSGGTVEFEGVDVTHLAHRKRRALAGDMQVVFQDPYSSLNPTRTIGQTLRESLRAQTDLGRTEVSHRVAEMLERVGLPADAAKRYPAHFSGGQRQRIAIARALMSRPRLVVCDEPVSSLDVSVQASVLNLLSELQRDFQLSYVFIAHDLAVVRYLSHRIVVLYRGRIMEAGAAATVYERPLHPYTRMLLEAAPALDPELQRSRAKAGRDATPRDPDAVTAPESCPFAPRCAHAIDICRTARPPLEPASGGVQVACHRWHELSGGGSRNGKADVVSTPNP
jgi:oligopeptide/dipeptide ABC transporter ATP-binding protein